jgi:hypothetical protein
MFIGKIGKILGTLNRNMNTTAPIFCPWTLKSIMLAREGFGAQFGSHLDQYR